MIITINTDAAYHSSHKVGAFAFWIKCDLGKLAMSGALKEKMETGWQAPTEAEIKCILNAIAALKSTGWIGIGKIIINTDSLNAIHILTKDQKAIQKYLLKWGGKFRGQFQQMTAKFPCAIEFRHVPAHKNTDTPRAWVNEWCDQKAKEALWAQINKK